MTAIPITSRDITKPAPGYWLVRLGRNRPWVPAAIIRHHTTAEPGEPANRMERSPFLAGYISGEIVEPMAVWLMRGRPISKAEYDFQVADQAWLFDHAPHEPKARPTEPVDFNALPPLF